MAGVYFYSLKFANQYLFVMEGFNKKKYTKIKCIELANIKCKV